MNTSRFRVRWAILPLLLVIGVVAVIGINQLRGTPDGDDIPPGAGPFGGANPDFMAGSPISTGPLVDGERVGSLEQAGQVVGYPVVGLATCAANDGTIEKILVSRTSDSVLIRYAPVDHASCRSYPSGRVSLLQFPTPQPASRRSGLADAKKQAARLGGIAHVEMVNGTAVVLQQGNWPGDCDQGPAPHQEGCAPPQANPASATFRQQGTTLQILAPGSWASQDLAPLVASVP